MLKKPKHKTRYIVFEDTPYYPYVIIVTTDRKKAEKEYNNHGDTVYLCKIIKVKTC